MGVEAEAERSEFKTRLRNSELKDSQDEEITPDNESSVPGSHRTDMTPTNCPLISTCHCGTCVSPPQLNTYIHTYITTER